ncbi:MAG TPA: glycosyltransferase family 4 protein [bacterium]
MKIVHVAPYYPPHLGGMETLTRQIAERTAAAGLDVRVVTSALPRRPAVPDGVSVSRCAAFEFARTPVIPGLVPRLLRLPPDAVVHLHVAQPLVPELVRWGGAVRRFPFIAHLHLDIGPSGPLGCLLPLYKRLLLAPVLRAAAAVVVYTPGYARLVAEAHGVAAERIEVIPAGVEPPPSGDSWRGEERLLFVGRLCRQKNIPLLLEAVHLLVRRGRPTTLRIVGEGEERERLQRLVAALKLEDRVVFAGRLEGAALSREYGSAAALALPSERESFGIVLIEAMSHGTPAVATDIPGVRDVIADGRTGLLAAPEPRSFAGALEAVLADRGLWARLSAAGRVEAARYDWPRIVARYVALYERVAAAGRTP